MLETINIVGGALSQALETMAFMEIMPVEEDTPEPTLLHLTEIDFVGQQNGYLQILAGRAFAEILAENIGALDEVTDEDGQDALKELANVTCGLITPVMASDTSDIYDLTVPSINIGDSVPQWHMFADDRDACVLNVEGHLIAVKLKMHS
jgi:chemotaxis protein CheY-P-specific phosphatase CheC